MCGRFFPVFFIFLLPTPRPMNYRRVQPCLIAFPSVGPGLKCRESVGFTGSACLQKMSFDWCRTINNRKVLECSLQRPESHVAHADYS